MENALKMGRVSARGGFQLFVGIVASNVIMAVGTIVLARVLSPAEYGLYAVVLIPSVMINLFRDWGVNHAITRYVAHFRATEKEDNIRAMVAAGLVFEISTGLVLSLISIFLASFIASTILNRPEAAPLISIISIAIFSGSLLTVAQNSLIGFERMEYHSLTLTIQAIFKSVVSPLLVMLGFGVLGVVLGYTLSYLVTSVVSLIILYFLLLRNLKRTKVSRIQLRNAIKTLLSYGVPLSIASILLGILSQFYSFMMAIYVNDIMIGNLHVATNFTVILTFLAYPISTVLFPTFAKLDSPNDRELLNIVFTSSIKYTAILLMPATAAMMVLSKPMISTLFGEQWIYAPSFLTLYVMSYILLGIGNLSVGGFLSGLGETKTQMKLSLLTTGVGIPLAFLLIPSLGMVGVIIGPIVAGVPSTFLGLNWIWKRYHITADWASSARIFAASLIAAGTTYLSLSFVHAPEPLRLLIGGSVFLTVYILSGSLIGAIVQNDVSQIREIISSMGFVSKVADPPLKLVEKVVGKIGPLNRR